MLCNLQPLATSLSILSLVGNSVSGGIAPKIGKCSKLTRLLVGGNHLSGNLPTSLALLVDLKRLDFLNNEFSGELPDLSRISGWMCSLPRTICLVGGYPNLISPILSTSMSPLTSSVATFQMSGAISLPTASLAILSYVDIHRQTIPQPWLAIRIWDNQMYQVLQKARLLCIQVMLHWVLSLSFL